MLTHHYEDHGLPILKDLDTKPCKYFEKYEAKYPPKNYCCLPCWKKWLNQED